MSCVYRISSVCRISWLSSMGGAWGWQKQQSGAQCPACSLCTEYINPCRPVLSFPCPTTICGALSGLGNYLGRYGSMSPSQYLNQMLLYLLDRWRHWSVERMMVTQLWVGEMQFAGTHVWLSGTGRPSSGIRDGFPVCVFLAPFISLFLPQSSLCIENKCYMLTQSIRFGASLEL